MNNQKNENEKFNNSGIDLSQFPIRQKEPIFQPKPSRLENFKRSWQRMGKENQIFTIIIVIVFILIIVLLISLFGRIGGKEITPIQSLPEYPPSAEEGGI